MQRLVPFTAWSAALLAGAAVAQQPAAPAPQQHVRGDIVALKGDTLEIESRSGESMKLKLAEGARVAVASKADLASIGDGAFIGTTAVPQNDGTLRAVEVHVFPDSMRGTGEGHRPWDLQPGSTMTNATVAKVDESGGARKLSLKYKDGEKTVVVPAGTPVVRMEPGDRSKLVPGAHVFVIASRQLDGTLVAERLTVGKDGLVPPM